MLSWHGTLYGFPVEGVVEGGAISSGTSSPAGVAVCSAVEAYVRRGVRVGIGPFSGPASLTDPILARAAVAAALDEGTAVFEGEAPVPRAPDDAES